MFIPPQKRRTTSGKTNTYTPTRTTPRSVIYGDQILNVQVRTPAEINQRSIIINRKFTL